MKDLHVDVFKDALPPVYYHFYKILASVSDRHGFVAYHVARMALGRNAKVRRKEAKSILIDLQRNSLVILTNRGLRLNLIRGFKHETKTPLAR
jgi:hypothetical protein